MPGIDPIHSNTTYTQTDYQPGDQKVSLDMVSCKDSWKLIDSLPVDQMPADEVAELLTTLCKKFIELYENNPREFVEKHESLGRRTLLRTYIKIEDVDTKKYAHQIYMNFSKLIESAY